MKSERHSKGFLETFPLVSVTRGSVPLTCLLAPFSLKLSCANTNSSVPPACTLKISSTAGLKQNYVAQLHISAAESTALSEGFNFGSEAMDWPRCAVLIRGSGY